MSCLTANAMMSCGTGTNDYGISISQRLLKANNDFEPPKKKKYNPVKSLNDKMWGYYEEFNDNVQLGDSVNLRSIVKECPNFLTYFAEYDHRLHTMIKQYSEFIEHARLGEYKGIMDIFESNPEFTHVIHSFVGNIDIKKQCNAIQYLAKRKDSTKLMQYIRSHAEILTTVTGRYDTIRASSIRGERVIEFNDLLRKIKEGDNSGIRLLRGSDPTLSSDIADIIECDRLVNFETMLSCAAEGNTTYMKYLVKLYPYLVNYTSEQGESILLNAVKNEHLSTVKVLSNSDFATTDLRGRSALHFTCGSAMKSLTYYLIHNGARVDAQDEGGNTPLHYVCSATKPSVTIIKMLISGSAKIYIPNKQHMTCLDILTQNGHDSLANYLKSTHKKEAMRPAIRIKSEKEKKRDLICHKHLSYSCPCAVAKKEKEQAKVTAIVIYKK